MPERLTPVARESDVPLPPMPLVDVPLPPMPLLATPLPPMPLLATPLPPMPLVDVPLPPMPLVDVPLPPMPLLATPLPPIPLVDVPLPPIPLVDVPLPPIPLGFAAHAVARLATLKTATTAESDLALIARYCTFIFLVPDSSKHLLRCRLIRLVFLAFLEWACPHFP